MKNNKAISFPFLKKMEQILKSLSEGMFDVKADGNGYYSVYFKRVVVVGPLPNIDIAKSIAEEYNNITERRKTAIKIEIDLAEKKIIEMCSSITNNIVEAIQPNLCDVGKTIFTSNEKASPS